MRYLYVMEASINDNTEHLLQKHGVLVEFDIISITSLESFMNTYDKIANSPDDISALSNVSKLLNKSHKDIPGFIIKNASKESESNPELNKISYTLIEFIMKKTQDPADWAYILTYVINKMGLEFDEKDDDDTDE